jgi:hypothetical protein
VSKNTEEQTVTSDMRVTSNLILTEMRVGADDVLKRGMRASLKCELFREKAKRPSGEKTRDQVDLSLS